MGTAGEGASQQLGRFFPVGTFSFSRRARVLDASDEAVLLEFVQAQKTEISPLIEAMTWLQGPSFNRPVKPLPRLQLLSCSKDSWKRGRTI